MTLLRNTLSGHMQGISAMASDPQGTVLLTGDGGGRIRAWDFKTGDPLGVYPAGDGSVRNLALHPTGIEFASSGAGGMIQIWEPAQPKPEDSFPGNSRMTLAMNYRQPGNVLEWTGVEGSIFSRESLIHSRAAEVRAAAIDPAGRWLAFAGHLQNAELLDRENDYAARSLEGHRRNIYSLAFNPDGSLLASGCADCNVRIWETTEVKPELTLKGHRDPVVSLAFSRDGEWLASGDSAGSIILWNTSEGRELARFAMTAGGSADVVEFGWRGRALAAGGTGSVVQIWDLSKVQSK